MKHLLKTGHVALIGFAPVPWFSPIPNFVTAVDRLPEISSRVIPRPGVSRRASEDEMRRAATGRKVAPKVATTDTFKLGART